jgi:hypothetical protein
VIRLAIAAAALWSSAADAQPATPDTRREERAATLQSGRGRPASVAESLQIMDRFGACLVQSHARAVLLITGPNVTDADFARLSRSSEVVECLYPGGLNDEARLRFNRELLRGSVFKALYARDHGKDRPVFSSGPTDWSAMTVGWSKEEAQRFVLLHRLAQCALMTEPAPAHDVILAKAGTQAQKQAMNLLSPAIGDCLPDGLQLELPRPSFIGALAEVAYRSAQQSKD